MALYDHVGQCMAMYDYVWLCWAMYGHYCYVLLYRAVEDYVGLVWVCRAI